ncbi:MAG TPA: malto-oligosyltrehalose synthase [Vicinamibacterales bacterium]
MSRRPIATYRLQFNRDFTFLDARTVVDYLHRLGISDCYSSSYLAAVPDSPHGYDVADPTHLNPDLGSEDDYWEWVEALRTHGMGHVLDLVPNHMGIAKSANPWWQDVLENGPSSRFARVFDIEWRPVKDELADKVLIPILGDQYGAVLERQELRLFYERGAFTVRYYDDLLPIAPDTYGLVLGVGLTTWLNEHPGPAAEELQSILTASAHLPARSTHDPEAIVTRAREKEVVKRRLAALTGESPIVQAYVDDCVTRINGTRGHPRSFDRLDGLLNAQSYRLAHWRVASEEINYRRFFDVNKLAAVRMEDPWVFEEVHRFAIDLIRRGGPTGLRIDHVDGLFAPRDYLQRLQTAVGNGDVPPAIDPTRAPHDPPFFVVVEKILGTGERVPDDWPVAGTTGYEFGAMTNNLFVDARNTRAFDEIYRRFVREALSFAELSYRAKKQVLHETMSGDINSLGHQLNRFSERNRHFRDFTLYSLISALKDVIACFPVYRTYITAADPVSEGDARFVRDAVRCAKRRSTTVPAMVFDFVERLLLKQTPIATQDDCDERARFIGKFQQLTSPVAAKGIEDTALYVYNRLLSMNEVGGDPTRFGIDPAAVHEWMIERQRRWPAALSALSTHDSKRGEDVRARLNVLSEVPGAWKAMITKWRGLNRRLKVDVLGATAPDANEEYFLYQTLVGIWPFDRNIASIRERMSAYITKALREAKVHTSWLTPNEEYEAGVIAFLNGILDRRKSSPFLQSFEAFQARVAELGIYNSLAQLLVKITAPGVPDFYQGTELWDFTLVDPDNRRPVDYGARRDALSSVTALRGGRTGTDAAEELLRSRTDGRIKMFVTTHALEARATHRSLFEDGEYLPLAASGIRRDSIFAYARRRGDSMTVTCVPRLVASLIPDVTSPPVGSAVWGDTRIELPTACESCVRNLNDVFTRAGVRGHKVAGRLHLNVSELLERFPVALLVPSTT